MTSDATWTSANPLIADFDKSTPGLLNVFATGETQILATYEFAGGYPMTIFVSLDAAPRQDTDITIDVRRAGTVLEGIPDAQVDITPDGATSQRCITDRNGYWPLSFANDSGRFA